MITPHIAKLWMEFEDEQTALKVYFPNFAGTFEADY